MMAGKCVESKQADSAADETYVYKGRERVQAEFRAQPRNQTLSRCQICVTRRTCFIVHKYCFLILIS
jgi:hypothetical protein